MLPGSLWRRGPAASLLILTGCVLFISLGLVRLSHAEPAKNPGLTDAGARKTVTYDVADLAERMEYGIDDLVLMILRNFHPDEWRKGSNALRVVNETQLVIRAPATMQEEIAEYLTAMRLNLDADVIVEGKLYEVESASYAAKIGPLLGKQADEKSRKELLDQLSSQGTLIHSGQAKIHDRHEATFCSLRQAYLYKRWSDGAFAESLHGRAYELGFHGATFKAKVFVTGDRLRVHLRLSERVTQLQEMGSTQDYNPRTEKKELVDLPRTTEQTSTFATEVVADGQAVVRHLAWKTLEAKEKGRELILVARPVIYIEREEQDRKGAQSAR